MWGVNNFVTDLTRSDMEHKVITYILWSASGTGFARIMQIQKSVCVGLLTISLLKQFYVASTLLGLRYG